MLKSTPFFCAFDATIFYISMCGVTERADRGFTGGAFSSSFIGRVTMVLRGAATGPCILSRAVVTLL